MSDTSAITVLITRIRRRILVASSLDMFTKALWICAAIICAGGLVHRYIHELTFLSVIIAGAIPLLSMPAWTLTMRRPTASSAAIAADQWFDGHALMVSAVELLLHPPAKASGAAAFVIEQAECSAHRWVALLPNRPKWRPPRYLPAPVGLIMVGIFLLSLPGAVSPQAARHAHSADATDSPGTTNDGASVFPQRVTKPNQENIVTGAHAQPSPARTTAADTIAMRPSDAIDHIGRPDTGRTGKPSSPADSLSDSHTPNNETAGLGNPSAWSSDSAGTQPAAAGMHAMAAHDNSKVEIRYLKLAEGPRTGAQGSRNGSAATLSTGVDTAPALPDRKTLASPGNLVSDSEAYTETLTPWQRTYIATYYNEIRMTQ